MGGDEGEGKGGRLCTRRTTAHPSQPGRKPTDCDVAPAGGVRSQPVTDSSQLNHPTHTSDPGKAGLGQGRGSVWAGH